jgi:hypothetical protein
VREYGIYASVTMSNSINTLNEQYITKLQIYKPLVLKLFIGLKDDFSLKNISGNLYFSSGKIIYPDKIYIENKKNTGCFSTNVSPKEDRFYISKDSNIDFYHFSTDRSVGIKMITNGVELTDRYLGCLVFEYPEPVPVDNVFKVNFGKIYLMNGKAILFEEQFYPLVRKTYEK